MKIVSRLQGGGWGKRIFVLTFALGIVPAVPVSLAQELLPELAAPAAKYKSAIEALAKEKQDSVTRAAQSYVTALNSVETSAASSGKTDVVAAVAKEHEALAYGMLEPDLPAVLPSMRLQGTRRALVGKLNQINADHARRKNQLDSTYTTALIALQEKAAANPELAKQIAAEKAALLEGGKTGTGGGQKSNKSNANNVVVNGGFEELVEGKPANWEFGGATILSEEGNNFMRFDSKPNKDGSGNRHQVGQKNLEIPPKAEEVTVSARMRTAITNRGGYGGPNIWVEFFDSTGMRLLRVEAPWREKNGSWKKIQKESGIPSGAVKASVTLITSALGQIDYDDIAVTFK